MNKADLIKNGFFVALTGTDEEKRAIAIEVIDKAVEAGAKLMEGVDGYHRDSNQYVPEYWDYIGVKNKETFFYDDVYTYGSAATKLTLQQFREVFGETKETVIPDEKSIREQYLPIVTQALLSRKGYDMGNFNDDVRVAMDVIIEVMTKNS